MNNKNLNCHPEHVEGSQPLHISSRDVAEDTRLNYELDKWFWMPYRKGFALRGMTVLFLLACFPSFAQAETCTPTPDCKSLGYTETSCPDGGVKCPWNTSLMYCDSGGKNNVCQNCFVGRILNSDMTCSQNKVNGKTPIGVVASQTVTNKGATITCVGMAVALHNISFTNYSDGKSQCNSYSASGVTGWHLPTKEELLTIHGNISSMQSGLTKAGGTQLYSNEYWSSSLYTSNSDGTKYYWIVNPVSGDTLYGRDYVSSSYGNYVRPVLKISWEGQL